MTWPNMALTKHGFKTKFGLKLGERTVERERREEEKRKEEEEEEKKKRSQDQRYGTTWNSKVLYEFPCLDGY